jgi:putative multiple sugar transport system permease protein
LGFGILGGLISSFLVAQLGIPAFVATLAGWLGYRGALQLVTRSTGTIIIPNETFNAIGNGFIPDIPDIGILPGVHKLTLILGSLGIILFVTNEIINRNRMQKNKIEVLIDRDIHP